MAQTNVLANQMKAEKAKQDIVKYREQLHLEDPRGYEGHVALYHRTIWMGALAEAYKTVGDIDNMKWCCRELIKYVEQHTEEIPGLNDKKAQAVASHFRKAHIRLAGAGSFFAFLNAIEWDQPNGNKFFSPRSNIISKDISLLQQLYDGELRGLAISAPPRTYKTALGTRFFVFNALMHPEESCFFASHTSKMCRKVFQDVLKILDMPVIREMFGNIEVNQSAEDLWIDIYPKKTDNGFHSMYFCGIDGNMAGVINCSWLLYCDDLLTEQDARNQDLVDNSWDKYATGIRQRRSGSKVRELHIATRWNSKDVVTTLEEMKSKDPDWKFIVHPALNESGESNFLFRQNPIAKEDFEEIKKTMNEFDYECIYQQHPLDKQGLLFKESDLTHRFKTLPAQEPDEIFGACDVAFSGTDSVAFPILYRYGDDYYIPDVVFDSRDYLQTEPVVADFIVKHQPNRAQFEANNGGEFYANDVKAMVKGKTQCRIEAKRTPSNVGKVARIEQFEPNIKKFYFLDKDCYAPDSAYGRFMKELCSFNINGKNRHDDAPDSLAQSAAMIRVAGAPKLKTFSRSLLF